MQPITRNRIRSGFQIGTVVLAFLITVNTGYAKKWPVYAKHGMVVSTERLASAVGVQILKQGGNAVDAAVATGFALAVVQPAAGNIGGGGFMLIRLADGTTAGIDYREKAPAAAHETMYLDEEGNLIDDLNHHSYLAVGVPGTVAGLTLALEKYGTMKLADVMAPAIRLAESGFEVPYSLGRDLKTLEKRLKKYPASEKKFFKPDGTHYQPGDIFVQPDLAATLRRISKHGREGFYKGKTAELIESDMKANGGLITRQDLADYQAVVRRPIRTTYRGYEVLGMPPPSSGGITVALMLNILEEYDLSQPGHNSAAYVHIVVEAMRRAFAARAKYLGDADFNPEMPVEKLISKTYAAELRGTISLQHPTKSDPEHFNGYDESAETTHFSVVDAAGNAVSNTYTIEEWYGSKIVAAGAGFLYNNEMGDFNPIPGLTDTTGMIGTKPNLIRPGKRMLSNMTPTIVTKDGRPFLITGSPGGKRIISTVLQIILNVTSFGMNVFEAVDAPRFHHRWLPDKIWFERRGFSHDTIDLLTSMGHRVTYRETVGRAMAILIDLETGWRMGAGDPRSANRAAAGD
ncbi:gamma-glutamyltransferase [candidate division KSB1 bacterium]|nr:gamma-glutamyltransferase [candidate division KSB1 bacterium]